MIPSMDKLSSAPSRAFQSLNARLRSAPIVRTKYRVILKLHAVSQMSAKRTATSIDSQGEVVVYLVVLLHSGTSQLVRT